MKLPKIDSASLPNAFAVSSGALRVTDPCYTPDTWCAGTLENVKNGIWQAHVGYHKDALDTKWGEKRLADEQARINELASKPDEDGNEFWKHYAKTEQMRLDKDRASFEARLGRVAYLHIVHENAQRHFDHEAEFDSAWVDSDIDVGVDSGQAGFFDLALYKQVWSAEPVKEKFYEEVCALTCDTTGDWGVHSVGCVSSTGWGDGSYTCLVRRDEELRLIEAIIVYMSESEDEDDSEADEDNSHD